MVLIVDDSQYICDITSEFMKELGHNTIIAMGGQEGLDRARELLPDIVLLDVQMPQLNGFAVCELLRRDERTNRIPIILMSAVVDRDSFKSHSKLPYRADAYLTKPFMKKELQGLVTRFIGTESSVSMVDSSVDVEEIALGIPEHSAAEQALPSVPLDPALDLVEDVDISELEDIAGIEDGYIEEINELKEARTESEEQVSNLESTLSEKEKELEEIREELSQAVEESSGQIDALNKEKSTITKDLEAALTAKNEIEQQAQAILESRAPIDDIDKLRSEIDELSSEKEKLLSQVEESSAKTGEFGELEKEFANLKEEHDTLISSAGDMDILSGKVAEQEDRIRILDEERDEISARLEDVSSERDSYKIKLEQIESEDRSTGEQVTQLTVEVENLAKEKKEFESEVELLRQNMDARTELEAIEKKAREELTGRMKDVVDTRDELKEKLDLLEKKAAQGEILAVENENLNREVREIKGELEIISGQLGKEKEQAEKLKESLENLEKEYDAARGAQDSAALLTRKLKDTESYLESVRTENEGLRDNIVKAEERYKELAKGEGLTQITDLNTRLNEMEGALSRTVNEAQNTIIEQRDREGDLEENLRGLMSSLEEERTTFQKERESWIEREKDLRHMVEAALEEQRKIMGEEVARLVPMPIQSQGRTIEVVTGIRKWGIAVALSLLSIVIFVSGYLILSRLGGEEKRQGKVVTEDQYAAAVHLQGTEISVNSGYAAAERAYEPLWREQTVQSVSEDLIIQATLHTYAELKSAMEYATQRAKFQNNRSSEDIGLIERTFSLDDFFYITLFIKDISGGSGIDMGEMLTQMVLRDGEGNETRALAFQKAGSEKFVGSVIASVSGMNPFFSWDEGMVVAFPRAGLSINPSSIQLVLYDLGAVSMRTLPWEFAGT